MKTTIDLPDELFREAKAVAGQQRVTLRELVVEGLHAELARRRSPRHRVDFVFRTAGGSGLHPDVPAEEAIRVSYGLPS